MCYYGEPSFCGGEEWECETCGESFCANHGHVTDNGENTECVACERARRETVRKYTVNVQRVDTYTADVVVDATSEMEARAIIESALNNEGWDAVFGECEGDYQECDSSVVEVTEGEGDCTRKFKDMQDNDAPTT